MGTTARMAATIRWLIRRDMDEVLAIEGQSFGFPWTEEDFWSCLRQSACIGMVAERNGEIVGYMIYELHKSRINVLNFAVAGEARRSQVGTQMVQKLVGKLSDQRRTSITTLFRESNLSAQLFFRAMEFEAVAVLRGEYEDTDEDAYEMRYAISGGSPVDLRNRIGKYLD
jgi:[ribosomal protein S18]-alanine N-acetyltransferase